MFLSCVPRPCTGAGAVPLTGLGSGLRARRLNGVCLPEKTALLGALPEPESAAKALEDHGAGDLRGSRGGDGHGEQSGVTMSGAQSTITRAFNDRLKKLVDKSEDVHFAQTYPQALLAPISTLTPPQPAEAAAHRSTLVLTDAQPSSQ